LKIVSNLTQGWKVNRKLNKCPTRQIGKETNHDKMFLWLFPKLLSYVKFSSFHVANVKQ